MMQQSAANSIARSDARQLSCFTAWSVQLVILLVAGLLLRGAAFGDPNIHDDEAFYLLVGHEMHHGAIPYVDIWDRKPLGLFIAYWIFAAFPDGVLAYQISAWVSASLTAFLICRIAVRWMPPTAALAGGILYLCMLGALSGMGGQSPVFYNSLVAGGALLVLQFCAGAPVWRLYLAMLLLGLAITFKQTATFEAVFLGLVAVYFHRDWRKALIQIAIGAAPFAAISAWYAAAGYWNQFYYSMVTTNLLRPPMSGAVKAHNLSMLLLVIGPLIGVALYAFTFCRTALPRWFLLGWLAAAIMGWASVPYFLEHYALPLMIPVCIIAVAAFTRRPIGPALMALSVIVPLLIAAPWNYHRHRASAAQFEAMVDEIQLTRSSQRLLVFSGPSLLYPATGAHPLSPLAFPDHLSFEIERNMGPLKSGPELERIISLRPTAVVMYETPPTPPDRASFDHLLRYVHETCAAPLRATMLDSYGHPVINLVYAGCGSYRREIG